MHQIVDNFSQSADHPVMKQEERIFKSIEQAISEHRLTPGTRLREAHLAEIYGVKRGLIRKVLSKLAHNKLIEHLPNVGAQVAQPSAQEGRDLFATRRILEKSVVASLNKGLTSEQVHQLNTLLREEQKAYESGNNKLGVRLSAGFHKLLAEIAGNRVSEEFLVEIINRTPLVIISNVGQQPPNGCVNHEHNDIVNALVNKDCEKAIQLMDEHLSHLENMFNIEEAKPVVDLAEILKS
jgi:DNA-binding GntR family transcriptional regulator